MLPESYVMQGPPTAQPRITLTRPALYGTPFTYLHEFLPLASGAVASRDFFTVDGAIDYFALHRLSVLVDDLGATLMLEGVPSGESFLQTPSFLSHLGSGQRPTQLSPPVRVARATTFTAVCSDRKTTAADNNIRIAHHGAKMYRNALHPARLYRWAKPYIYTINFTANDGGLGAVAANANDHGSVSVDPDSDFEIQKMTVVADGACTLRIRTREEDWSSDPIRVELYGGSTIETPASPAGLYPFLFPVPALVRPSGYISVNVVDVSGASNRVQVAFHGLRLYP